MYRRLFAGAAVLSALGVASFASAQGKPAEVGLVGRTIAKSLTIEAAGPKLTRLSLAASPDAPVMVSMESTKFTVSQDANSITVQSTAGVKITSGGLTSVFDKTDYPNGLKFTMRTPEAARDSQLSPPASPTQGPTR